MSPTVVPMSSLSPTCRLIPILLYFIPTMLAYLAFSTLRYFVLVFFCPCISFFKVRGCCRSKIMIQIGVQSKVGVIARTRHRVGENKF